MLWKKKKETVSRVEDEDKDGLDVGFGIVA